MSASNTHTECFIEPFDHAVIARRYADVLSHPMQQDPAESIFLRNVHDSHQAAGNRQDDSDGAASIYEVKR